MADEELKVILKNLTASNQEVKDAVRESRETLTAEIRSLREELGGEIKELKEKNQALQAEVSNLKEKLQRVELQSKKYKIVIHGLNEEDTSEELATCLKLFNQTLGVDCRFEDFRNFYRIGKPISGKVRPISVECNSYFLRSDILKNVKKLKGSKIYITPEYTREEYEDRKILNIHLRAARQNSQEAIIRNNTLIVDGLTYTLKDLEKRKATDQELERTTGITKESEGSHSNKRKAPLSPTEIQQEIEKTTKRVTRNLGRDQNSRQIPNFTGPILNVTVPLGREAVLECGIDNLSAFKVAWLRVDTQTILTIHSHVITKNHRIAVTHTEHRNWYLHIRDIRETDMGWYMCQINTDPMKSQVGFLNVVVPPDILDYPTSADMVVREGLNVTMQCAATGSPKPSISWRREGGEPLTLSNGLEVPTFEGPVLNISKVNRLNMGPYLCIASNGVPPSVSKRIMLIVHFPPMIWIQNQLVGSMEGEQITLECHSEAFPKSINYWTKNEGHIISQGTKYEPVLVDNTYKVHMKLTIRSVSMTDYGAYKCVAKNSLGETDGTIKLYHIPTPSTSKPTTEKITKAPPIQTTSIPKQRIKQQKETVIEHEINEIKTQEITKERGVKLPSSDPSEKQQEKLNDLGDVFVFSSTSTSSTVILRVHIRLIIICGAIINIVLN